MAKTRNKLILKPGGSQFFPGLKVIGGVVDIDTSKTLTVTVVGKRILQAIGTIAGADQAAVVTQPTNGSGTVVFTAAATGYLYYTIWASETESEDVVAGGTSDVAIAEDGTITLS